MIEVEIKVFVKNITKIEECLLNKNFIKGAHIKESDYYFDNEVHEIRNNDQALRIRCSHDLVTDIQQNFVTFKGPKMDDISMTRKEIEIKIDNADACIEIFSSLGYKNVYPVIKERQYYHKESMTACIDQVEKLGCFLELEIIVENESEKNNALGQIISTIESFGYSKQEILRKSYLSMLQALCQF